MKRTLSISKLQHLLSALLLLALTGCGASNLAGINASAPGSLTAKLQWAESAKAVSKAVQSVPAGVVKMRMTVTGSDASLKALPVVRNTIDVTTSTTSGTVSGIYPGCVSLVVQALNASGAVVYEGFVISAAVTSGNTTDVGIINMIPPVEKAQDSGCVQCHETTLDGTGQNLVADFKQSGHYTNSSWTFNVKNGVTGTGCAGCHGPSHNDADPTTGRCGECHASSAVAHNGSNNTSLTSLQGKCNTCHNSHNTTAFVGGGCTVCHAVGQSVPGTYVNDNSGVRAITTEFGKWSHHVTGVDLNDAHCAACHLEGKVVNGHIAVDTTKHMADAITHLRNADTDADLQWDPATPNHNTMDNFCVSCHDANGATSPASVAIQAVINTIPAGTGRVGTASALNPFGDTISNQYDQLSRGAVVAVKEQFDAGNTSHHGVMQARYTATNLTAAQFLNISSANFISGSVGVSRNSQPTSATLLATVGTLYETGKLSLYKPFGSSSVIADNSVLHCADCHTVGQWKAGSALLADGTTTTTDVIGAHGSNNEYMLRNSNGSDNTTAANTYQVCFLCHNGNQYGQSGVTALTTNNHNATVSHYRADTEEFACNSVTNNRAGFVGTASRLLRSLTSVVAYGTNAGLTQLAAGTLGGLGAGNILGNRCLNCHNSSDNKSFGGIHGNAFRVGATTTVIKNAGYKTYSSANGASIINGSMGLQLVDRKPYRFLPGLGNFRYNGGADSDAWTRKAIGTTGKSEKMGCYTLNGTSSRKRTNSDGTVEYIPNVSPTKAQIAGARVSANALADDNGILGSWGACTDHAGSSIGAAGHSVTRTSIRPTSY